MIKKTTTEKAVPAKKKAPAKKKVAKTSEKKSVKSATKSEKTAAPKKRVPAKKSVPAPKTVPVKPGHGLDLVKRCVAALDEKKAKNIEVIEVGAKSSVTDYYVIATGTSDPHLRALRIALEKAIDEVVPAGATRVQNETGSGWCCVDAFDVVIHVFSEEKRDYYNLEELYKQGETISLEQ